MCPMPNLKQQTPKEDLTLPSGLYIHFPFCRSKCPYCDFYSIASSSLIARWLESLKREIVFYRGEPFTSFDTVYLGGGTPSILEVSIIGEILDCVKGNYKILEGAEITIEVNPGDMKPEKVAGIKSLGINRINLGVQSFNDGELLFLGRRHRAEDSVMALDELGKAGFINIGIDLIYGLKGQSLEGWVKTLERAVSFEPKHISCYQLTIEGKTVFNAMKSKGELEELSEDIASIFFLKTSEYLESQGYIHYEVSNYSKGTGFRSRHNSKYWQRIPYLGLGPSAHSFDGEKRWWNYRSVKKYYESLENNMAPVDDYEILSEEQAILEKISLAMRTIYGIGRDDLENIPGAWENIQKLVTSGHIEILNNRIIPTKKGLLVADQLPLYIIHDS